MEIIKRERLNGYDIILVRFDNPKFYEVMIAKKPYKVITESYDEFNTLKDGLKIWRTIRKEIKNGVYK